MKWRKKGFICSYETLNLPWAGKTYFDFGISTEENGTVLNEGLVGQKEMFGGRGIAYDFYEIDV